MSLKHLIKLALVLAGIVIVEPVMPRADNAISAGAATAPPNLVAAVAQASAEPHWRTELFADGRVAAIGVDTISGVTHVVGIACGDSQRPEIAANVRGNAVFPHALRT